MTWKERRRAAGPPPLWFTLLSLAVSAGIVALGWCVIHCATH